MGRADRDTVCPVCDGSDVVRVFPVDSERTLLSASAVCFEPRDDGPAYVYAHG